MASATATRGESITGINVTPLVDVVLVLLIILMVTAWYITSRAIPVELPKAASGEASTQVLAITLDAKGQLFLMRSGPTTMPYAPWCVNRTTGILTLVQSLQLTAPLHTGRSSRSSIC